MTKNYFLLALALVCFAGSTYAQNRPCATDEMHKRLLFAHPELAQLEAEYEKQINDGLKKIDFRTAKKTTFTDETDNANFWYDIPIVVHVIHDYGNDKSLYLTDDDIFNDLLNWNIVYAKENYDTNSVVAPFVPYIGNPHIRLHLASRDPNGNPTKGITRHRSYLNYYGGDQSKFDGWPPTSYVNIWTVEVITTGNGEAAAYAYFPSSVTYVPFYDGVISDASYLANEYTGALSVSKTINHEMGHVFSLYHPWGGTNNPGVACGDDEVDDTPPTMGHVEPGCRPDLPSSNPNSLYDSACATNYFKLYSNDAGLDSLVNYPDTTNTQNIMDYTYCSRMFTKGQVYRMHQALNSDVAGRNNLWSVSNLYITGVLNDTVAKTFTPRLDLKPIPEFEVTPYSLSLQYHNDPEYFTFPGTSVTFRNETWNDTLSNLDWTFSNGALHSDFNSSTNDSALTYFNNNFSTPGWVDVKMHATGNGASGDTTVEWPRAVFVADAAGLNANSYFQDFNGADTAKWPSFNYYNNEFKWQWANVGYLDNSCIMYTGYDNRYNPLTGAYPNTGSPYGDFDDFFSIPFDLSSYTGYCSLNYFYSGASRSSNAFDLNDTLEIDYSVRESQGWNTLAVLTKRGVDNMGPVGTAFYPTSASDWAQMSINLPAAAKTNYTVFRWRYKPGVAAGYDGTVGTGIYSSGNNFFMDRVFFSPFPAGVANVKLDNMDVAIAPNPTNGDAYVIIKDAEYAVANIVVCDITGKEVFRTSEQLTSNEARILIPHDVISVPGMYVVQTATGSQVHTQKLMVQ